MIGKISGLLFARVVTLTTLLLFNFLLVKHLTANEIGVYYLLTTISYLGNAVVFVGADLFLQKKIAKDIQAGSLNKAAFLDFLFKTSLIGSLVVLIFSLCIFSFLKVEFVQSVLVCTLLTTTTYLTSLLRNIYQTAAKPFSSSAIQLADTVVKLLTIFIFVQFQQSTAHFLLLSYLFASAVLLIVIILVFLSTHKNTHTNNYFEGFIVLGRQIFPIGGAGFLNWVQLQSYRPYLSITQHNFSAIGAISFLTNLGSTATNAVMTILSQLYLPRIYATQGRFSLSYLILIACFGCVLALLSLPFGWLFLTLANKEEMISAIYLIPIGVFQEVINAMIGGLTIHYTIRGLTLSIFPFCTLSGVILMLIMLAILFYFKLPVFFSIALSLISSQLLVIVLLFIYTIKNRMLSYKD